MPQLIETTIPSGGFCGDCSSALHPPRDIKRIAAFGGGANHHIGDDFLFCALRREWRTKDSQCARFSPV